MTTPSSITVSLDMAKKLKEAGWPQNCNMSQWTWVECTEMNPDRNKNDPNAYKLVIIGNKGWTNYWAGGPDWPLHPMFAAPTAEEILRRLPVSMCEKHDCKDHEKGCGQSRWLIPTPDLGFKSWHVAYVPNGHVLGNPSVASDTLANAAAAMWCYLADNKLLP